MSSLKSKRVLAIAGLIVAIAFTIVFLRSQSPGGSSLPLENMEQVSLRLSWIPQATFSGDYAAQKMGYWEKLGLKVSINPGGFQYDSIKLVAAGTDLIGIASGAELIEARANGVPIVAIGVVIPDSPIGWVSKAGSGITSPKEFLGKKVGDQTGSLTEITLDTLFEKLDLPIDQIRRIPMQYDYQPFVSGALDVVPVYIIDQVVTFNEQGLEIDIVDPRDYGVNLGPANLYFVHEKTLSERPEAIRRFLDGAANGWKFAQANQAEISKYLDKYAEEMELETIQAQMKAVFEFISKDTPNYPGVFEIREEQFLDTVRTLQKYGKIDSSFDQRAAWSNDFL